VNFWSQIKYMDPPTICDTCALRIFNYQSGNNFQVPKLLDIFPAGTVQACSCFDSLQSSKCNQKWFNTKYSTKKVLYECIETGVIKKSSSNSVEIPWFGAVLSSKKEKVIFIHSLNNWKPGHEVRFFHVASAY
jgi:hypothetical protein